MAEEELMPGQVASKVAEADGQTPPPSDSPPPDDGGHRPKVGEEAARHSNQEEKPDWLPDKFFVDGQPQYENLAKSYGELEKKVSGNREELEREIREEAAKNSERPESAEKYTLPKLEGVNQDELKDHPMVGWFRNYAFERGLSDKDFGEAVSKYIEDMRTSVPNYEEEKKKLGDDADRRIAYVKSWVEKNITDADEKARLDKQAQTADGFRSIEAMIARVVQNRAPGDGSPAPVDNDWTYEEVKAKMNSPAYWDPARRDEQLHNDVSAWFERNAHKLK